MRRRATLSLLMGALLLSACASRAPEPADECAACRAVTIAPPPSER